jgi:hypothetical protein
VEELGSLEREIGLLRQKEARNKEIKDQVAKWAKEFPADHWVHFEARGHTAQASPQQKQRRIASMKKVFQFFGVKKFLELCSISLKAIDDHTTAEQRESLLVEERDGLRKVRTVVNAP